MKKAKYLKWLGRVLNVLIIMVLVYMVWSIADSRAVAKKMIKSKK